MLDVAEWEGTVDAQVFREALMPTIGALRALAMAIDATGERHGRQETATSKAMEEIADEEVYAKRSKWEHPVTDAHTFGAMTLNAASDYTRTFAATIDSDPTPVYAHLVIARSAFEASTVSSWLNQPRLDTVDRVKRGLCEQLYNAKELVRLGIEDDAGERLDFWRQVANDLGWTVNLNPNKPIVDGVRRPSVPQAIDELLEGGPASRIGRVQWSYLSSVSHVTWYGLRQSMFDAEEPDAAGITRVSYGTSSSSARAQAICLLRCLRKAAEKRFILAGWQDPDWDQANRQAADHENALLVAAAAGDV